MIDNIISQRLNELLNLKTPEQKTEEWYKDRSTRMTASDLGSQLNMTRGIYNHYKSIFPNSQLVFDPKKKFSKYPKSQKSYILSKCENFHVPEVIPDETEDEFMNFKKEDVNENFEFGNKFEDVAVQFFEQLKNVKLYSTGMIKNECNSYLGTSPDSIFQRNTGDPILCKSSNDNGESIEWYTSPDLCSLEIKCPVSRELFEEDMPIEYFIQCLNHCFITRSKYCYFLDCKFINISMEKFTNIFDQENNDGIRRTGIILANKVGMFHYLPLDLVAMNEMIQYATVFISENTDYEMTFYHLKDYKIKRIKIYSEFDTEIIPQVKKIWERFTYLQSDAGKEELNEMRIKSTVKREKVYKNIAICIL